MYQLQSYTYGVLLVDMHLGYDLRLDCRVKSSRVTIKISFDRITLILFILRDI